ncbi:hypothetical protein ACP70R_049070 [Stipagrostis hirtigluma subsp. patula]
MCRACGWPVVSLGFVGPESSPWQELDEDTGAGGVAAVTFFVLPWLLLLVIVFHLVLHCACISSYFFGSVSPAH